MTAADSADTKGDSLKDSVFSNSLFRIQRTTWVETTRARQEGRHCTTVSG